MGDWSAGSPTVRAACEKYGRGGRPSAAVAVAVAVVMQMGIGMETEMEKTRSGDVKIGA